MQRAPQDPHSQGPSFPSYTRPPSAPALGVHKQSCLLLSPTPLFWPHPPCPELASLGPHTSLSALSILSSPPPSTAPQPSSSPYPGEHSGRKGPPTLGSNQTFQPHWEEWGGVPRKGEVRGRGKGVTMASISSSTKWG